MGRAPRHAKVLMRDRLPLAARPQHKPVAFQARIQHQAMGQGRAPHLAFRSLRQQPLEPLPQWLGYGQVTHWFAVHPTPLRLAFLPFCATFLAHDVPPGSGFVRINHFP